MSKNKDIPTERIELSRIINRESLNMDSIFRTSIDFKYYIDNNNDKIYSYKLVLREASLEIYEKIHKELTEMLNVSTKIDINYELFDDKYLLMYVLSDNHPDIYYEIQNTNEDPTITITLTNVEPLNLEVHDKYSFLNIPNIGQEKYLYSSYQTPIDLTGKEYVWCSPTLDQALLHPFNSFRIREIVDIQPVIYRFNINIPEKLYLLQSPNKNNVNIFRRILSDSKLQDICNFYVSKNKDEDINKMFIGENNYRILLILQIIN